MSNKNKDVDSLQHTITDMDALSQEGFSEIVEIARLAIKSMENKDNQHFRDTDDIIQALNVIWAKADDVQNCINCEAEDMGCSYISETTQQKLNEAMRVNHD